MKFEFGAGYRIYFGIEKDTMLIFLLGGSKKGQQKDIDKSKRYWKEYISLKGGKNEKK